MSGSARPYKLCLFLPGLPRTTNANAGKHWWRKHEEKLYWGNLIGCSLAGKKPKEPLEKAKLTLVRFSSVEPDFDGLVSSFKFVIDSLIDCGVIVDDRRSNIGRPHYDWQKADPKRGQIMIGVEELTDGN